MRKSTANLLWVVCLLLAWIACGPGAPAADVAAQLGDQAVPYAEFEAYLAINAIAGAPSLESEVLSGLFDQFLEELALKRLALEEGVAGGGTRAGVARLVEEATPAVARPEIEAYYRANRDRFQEPERVRVRQILVEDRATAELAARDLAAGAPFEDVAGELSQGPRAKLGGDQGVLSRDDLPPDLAAQIFELEPGEVSEIISADYGFHIFQISERLAAKEAPLSAAESEIVEELREQKQRDAVATLLERATKRYNVRVYSRNLPFRYQGHFEGP
ncbi:MAG: peptidylprolyl isomerase [Thermoanaerobaculia bacterium]